jgi:hypothetical protein
VRGVIESLVRCVSAVARSNGTLHSIFPVAVYAAEGEALREWVLREGTTKTIEIGLGYGNSALLVCEARLFHLAFVDGNHRFDGVFVDLVFLGRLVRAGGIEFVDDYQMPAVARCHLPLHDHHCDRPASDPRGVAVYALVADHAGDP